MFAHGLNGAELEKAKAAAKRDREAVDKFIAEMRRTPKKPVTQSRYDKACWAGRAGA